MTGKVSMYGGGVEEGKKMYTAFHRPDYVRDTFLSECELLEHIPQKDWMRNGPQDAWIARKL